MKIYLVDEFQKSIDFYSYIYFDNVDQLIEIVFRTQKIKTNVMHE